jgi:hypothetical protein
LGDSEGNKKTDHKEVELSESLIIRNKLYGKDLEDYELSKNKIPKVVESLIIQLYSNPSFLKA